MSLNLREWGSFTQIGAGVATTQEGKFYSLLETKKGAYRGNHVHPYNQYTVLMAGEAKIVWAENGANHEKPMRKGEITVMKAGVPHIMVPVTDIVTFEWWDGEFKAENLKGVFDEYTGTRVGPDQLQQEKR